MSTLNDELSEICTLSNNVKYGCLNIIISEKLRDLQKKGLISGFKTKDSNTVYVYCDDV